MKSCIMRVHPKFKEYVRIEASKEDMNMVQFTAQIGKKKRGSGIEFIKI